MLKNLVSNLPAEDKFSATAIFLLGATFGANPKTRELLNKGLEAFVDTLGGEISKALEQMQSAQQQAQFSVPTPPAYRETPADELRGLAKGLVLSKLYHSHEDTVGYRQAMAYIHRLGFEDIAAMNARIRELMDDLCLLTKWGDAEIYLRNEGYGVISVTFSNFVDHVSKGVKLNEADQQLLESFFQLGDSKMVSL